jgi:hypothetical protein
VDHVFFSGEFRLLRLAKMPDIDADHLPLFAELCLASEPPEPRPGPGDAAAIRAVLVAGWRAVGGNRTLAGEAAPHQSARGGSPGLPAEALRPRVGGAPVSRLGVGAAPKSGGAVRT